MTESINIRYIIARYKENTTWLGPILDKCCIINKGTDVPVGSDQAAELIQRENVGRESDSYIHYIIEHYDDLPDVCVFSQADISDHIRDGTEPTVYLNRLAQEALQFGMSRPRANCSNPYDKDWGPAWNMRNNQWFLEGHYKDDQPLIFHHWFIRNMCKHYPSLIQIHMNGIFAVRKDRILANPLPRYLRLRSHVDWHNNPIEGHFMERSWFYLFDQCSFLTNPSTIMQHKILKAAFLDKGLEYP